MQDFKSTEASLAAAPTTYIPSIQLPKPEGRRYIPSLQMLAIDSCPYVGTIRAAQLMGRQPQTLRKWSSLGIGPIRPVLVYGKLMWPMEQILNLLKGDAS